MRPALAPWILALSLSLGARPGLAADKVDKGVCAAAYVAAQSLRVDGHLLEARSQLSICAQAGCPASIANDCVRWQAEVASTLGSIAVSVRTPPGVDPAAVQVKIDGRAISAEEQATEVMVDPGSHALEVEAPGCTPQSSVVPVAKGQRSKRAEVSLVCAAGPAATSSGPRTEAAPRSSAPLFLAAAVGVVGMGVFSYLALSTKSQEKDLRNSCAPTCATADVDSLRHRYVAADIGLLFGVAGLATAGVLLFTAPASGHTTSAAIGFSPHGPSLSLQGTW